jgi:cytoskeletal protein CcmA (bactofilin family)
MAHDKTPTNADGGGPVAPLSKEIGSGRKSGMIGPSITIHGDVTGEEDLVVDGVIEGTVNLKENNLVVSENGKVTANVNARIIRVDGEVKGELRGTEQVSISPTGKVSGDIRAPRVVLEDGCQFKGSVDMESDKAGTAGERSRTPRLRPGGARPIRPGRDPADVLRG